MSTKKKQISIKNKDQSPFPVTKKIVKTKQSKKIDQIKKKQQKDKNSKSEPEQQQQEQQQQQVEKQQGIQDNQKQQNNQNTKIEEEDKKNNKQEEQHGELDQDTKQQLEQTLKYGLRTTTLRRTRTQIINEVTLKRKKLQEKTELDNFIKDFEKKYDLSQEKELNKNQLESIYQQLDNAFYKTQSQILEQKKKKKKRGKKIKTQLQGRVGLINLGNTCFMNSVIQCLSNIQPLNDYFLNDFHKREINRENKMGSKGFIATAFANLIKEIWSTQDSCIDPSEFFKVISYIEPRYAAKKQEDAFEFLIFLLDMLHEDLNRVKVKPYVEIKEYTKLLSQEEQEKLAADSWKDYLKRNKSVIVDLFQGQLKNTIKCLECGFMKYQFEPFMYLTLPLQDVNRNQKVSIQNCLDQFLKEEQLEDNEKWFCPHCKKNVPSSKKIDLWKLPNVLMICLKRFKYEAGIMNKINSSIQLDFNAFTLSNYIPPQLQKEKPIYQLFATICHRGGLSYGHYTAFAQNKTELEWIQYNDSRTFLIGSPEKQVPGCQSYMLLYQKSTNQLIKRQSITNPLNWPHMAFKEDDNDSDDNDNDKNGTEMEKLQEQKKQNETQISTQEKKVLQQDQQQQQIENETKQ
eukprot:TRINITY_DN3058_c0_g1_i1.p1 TRINITY_DN3058_c0_g1~~TRINITY_DN3058_c0_g1_i1.p1  ORF type:complete len:628 (-),score=146.91 TRINITY_DN3058_c0_g1_i1:3-1886(-)